MSDAIYIGIDETPTRVDAQAIGYMVIGTVIFSRSGPAAARASVGVLLSARTDARGKWEDGVTGLIGVWDAGPLV